MLGGYYLGQLYLGISGLPMAGILSVVPSSHQLSSDNITLVQKHTLVINSAAHTLSSENVTVTQKHQLTVEAAYHTLMSENAPITSEHFLGVQDAFHGVYSPEAVLTQKHTIVVNHTTHGLTSTSPTLVEHYTLVVQDATHGHTAQAPAITVKFYLSVQNATHSHTSANLGLTQKQVLIVNNSSHALSSTTIAGLLSILPNGYGGGFGAIEAWGLKQFGEINIEFPLHYYLIAANTHHTVADDFTSFTQKHNIAVADSTIGITMTDMLELVQEIFRYGGVYVKDFGDSGEAGQQYTPDAGTMPVNNGTFGQITPVSELDNGFLIVKMGQYGSYEENDITGETLKTGNSSSGNLTPEVADTGNYIKSNNNQGEYEEI